MSRPSATPATPAPICNGRKNAAVRMPNRRPTAVNRVARRSGRPGCAGRAATPPGRRRAARPPTVQRESLERPHRCPDRQHLLHSVIVKKPRAPFSAAACHGRQRDRSPLRGALFRQSRLGRGQVERLGRRGVARTHQVGALGRRCRTGRRRCGRRCAVGTGVQHPDPDALAGAGGQRRWAYRRRPVEHRRRRASARIWATGRRLPGSPEVQLGLDQQVFAVDRRRSGGSR